MFISMVITCVTVCETVFELAESFYASTTLLVGISIYVLTIVHYVHILKLIEKFKQFIGKSKHKTSKFGST